MPAAKFYEGQEFHNPADPAAPVLVYRAGKFFPKEAQGGIGSAPKLTEDQGKSQTYGRLMADAEGSYQHAVEDGYDPGSPRNAVASVLEGLPFGGLDGAGALVRDKVGDRGRQAEMQWSDAQLKAVSGAASPEAEVKRNVRTFFPRPGEEFSDIEPQKERARTAAFDSAKVRAGPAGEGVRGYGQGKPKPDGWTAKLPPAQLEVAMRFKGARAAAGTARNPSVPTDEQEYAALPPRTYYIHPSGAVKRKP
jgi:hypothetical protein